MAAAVSHFQESSGLISPGLNFLIHKMGCDSQWGNKAVYAEVAGNSEMTEGLADFKSWITGWANSVCVCVGGGWDTWLTWC